MTADDVIRAHFESLKPAPEEVQAMINQWPVIAETVDEAERAWQLGWTLDLAVFFSTADIDTEDDDGGT
ncbi:hypothetical protein GCM10011316_03230 [Roseibium aquae]|uniref:Uncharacterized protein n=1 Tax=Roseibium aquae TaxID=1323746 RepID=A0A916T8B0_9HYPH|nr:hypothetical protein [Roseibium aquae]GGB34519.1 hypothetical protein GCM10011316_03230 [Roseibium aquae]